MASDDSGPDSRADSDTPGLWTKVRDWASGALDGVGSTSGTPGTQPSAAFVVVLELLDTERGYTGLLEAIKGYPSAAQLTEAAWIVTSPLLPTAIRDDLKRFVGDEDRLFVARLAGPMSFSNSLSSTDEIKSAIGG